MSSRTRNRMSAGSGGSSGKGPEAAGSLVASGVVRQIDQPQVTKSRELERWQGRKALWAHHRTQRTQHPAQQLELNAGPTGSSHARPPNRPPRTGQAAPGVLGLGVQAGAGNGGGPSQLQSLGPGEEDAGRVRRSASPEPQWTAGEATRADARWAGLRTRHRAVTAPQPLAAPFPDLSLYLISSIVVAFTRNPGESRARGLAPPSAPAPPGAPA